MSVTSPTRPADHLAAALSPDSIAIIGASDNPHKVGGRPLMYLYAVRIPRPRLSDQPDARSRAGRQGVSGPGVAARVARPGDRRGPRGNHARRGSRLRRERRQGRDRHGIGLRRNAESRRPGRPKRRWSPRRGPRGMRLVGPNSQGPGQLRHRRGRELLDDVRRDGAGRRPGGDRQPERRDERGAVRPAAQPQASVSATRTRPATTRTSRSSELTLAVVHDPDVRLVLLYIEAIRDPDVLARAAAVGARTRPPDRRGEIGPHGARRAGGALAYRCARQRRSDRQRLLARSRHRRVDDVHELVRTSELYLKGWRPRGRELVIVSNSGASGVMAADTAAAHGLPLATFDDATRRALAAELPDFASVANPIDITAALLTESRLFGESLPLLTREGAGDLFLLAIPVAGEGYDVAAFARDAAAFAAQTGKPVVVAAPQETVADQFRSGGDDRVCQSDRRDRRAGATGLARGAPPATAGRGVAGADGDSSSGRSGALERSREPRPARVQRHAGDGIRALPVDRRGSRGVRTVRAVRRDEGVLLGYPAQVRSRPGRAGHLERRCRGRRLHRADRTYGRGPGCATRASSSRRWRPRAARWRSARGSIRSSGRS